MRDYNINEATREIYVFASICSLTESYIKIMLEDAYAEGLADGKIELLQEQIANVEVVIGGEK